MEQFTPFQSESKLQIRPKAIGFVNNKHRLFFHVDLDAFFASVEQLKDPTLKGKPVIVGGRHARRGVVAAASYEAKRCGVHAGMPWYQAKRCCPAAVFLPADFDAYAWYSERAQKILKKMAPMVAQASVDESYLDLTGCERIYGTPRKAAEKIHRAICNQLGLRISIGISGSQSVAKMASKLAKPSGMMEVPLGAETLFLSPFPVEMMPGIGPRLGERLRQMGILTLGQLACFPSELLRASFGIYGPYLKAKARGEDGWELEITETVKSIGKQKTMPKDLTSLAEVKKELFPLVEIIGKNLREKKLCARCVNVRLRYGNFTNNGMSKRLKDPTDFDRVLFRYAEELAEPLFNGKPVRLVGFSVSELGAKSSQLDLFRTPKAMRWERFYAGLDKIRNRFGRGSARFFKH